MSKKTQTVGDILRTQNPCNTDGLQGFPVKIDYRDFASITDEPSFQFRPQFQAGAVWSYDAERGEFDDGAYGQSSFYMQGKHYRVGAVRVVNRGTHWQWDIGHIPELQVWGVAVEGGGLAVVCIPIVRGAASNEGIFFRSMCEGGATVDLASVFPQGDGINMYYYVSCNPYVQVDKKYVPLSATASFTNVNVLLFTMPLRVTDDVFDKYVSNVIRADGFPRALVPSNAVYNDLMETDVAQTVKMTRTVDTSLELKKKSVFRKRGFTIPVARPAGAVKVFQVSEASLVDGTYRADLENAESLESYSTRKKSVAEETAVKLPPIEPVITPGKIALYVGVGLGLLVLLLIGIAGFYYWKRVFIPPIVEPLVKTMESTIENIGTVAAEIKAPAPM